MNPQRFYELKQNEKSDFLLSLVELINDLKFALSNTVKKTANENRSIEYIEGIHEFESHFPSMSLEDTQKMYEAYTFLGTTDKNLKTLIERKLKKNSEEKCNCNRCST